MDKETFSQKQWLTIRKWDEIVIVFDSETECLYELNENAWVILELIDGKNTVSDIIDKISLMYDTEDSSFQEEILYQIKKFEELCIIEKK